MPLLCVYTAAYNARSYQSLLLPVLPPHLPAHPDPGFTSQTTFDLQQSNARSRLRHKLRPGLKTHLQPLVAPVLPSTLTPQLRSKLQSKPTSTLRSKLTPVTSKVKSKLRPKQRPGASRSSSSLASSLYYEGSAGPQRNGAVQLLSGGAPQQTCMALYPKPIYLTDDSNPSSSSSCTPRSFSTNFTFVAATPRGIEGFALVLLSNPTLGAAGASLGYARSMMGDDSLARYRGAAAVEFDGKLSPQVGVCLRLLKRALTGRRREGWVGPAPRLETAQREDDVICGW